jgi:hypothetical protein
VSLNLIYENSIVMVKISRIIFSTVENNGILSALCICMFIVSCSMDKTSSGIQPTALVVFCEDSVPQPSPFRTGFRYLDTICVNDTAGKSLSFHFADSVNGLSMNDFIISWTPTEGDTGIHHVFLVASDGAGGFDTLRWTLAVLPNHAPVFDSTHPRFDTAAAGSQFRDSIAARDADNDSISFSLVQGPAHMTFSGNILQFSPVVSDSGTTVVSVAAADGHGGFDTLTFRLTVPAADRSPVFLSTAAGMKLIAYVNEEYRDTIHASDPDGDTVRFSMAAPVPGVQITDNVLIWTPSWSDFNDTVAVKVYACDARSGLDSLQWKIRVIERPPYFISTPSVMNVQATVGKASRDTVRFIEGDGEELSFIDSVAGMQIVNNSIILWTPAAKDTGTHAVSVVLFNYGEGADTLHWAVTVHPQAVTPVHVPFVVSPPQDTTIFAGKQYAVSFPDTDNYGNTITYTLSTYITGLSLSGTIISWTPAPADSGTHSIAITANNHKDLTSVGSWNVTVFYKPNHPPQFSTIQTKQADTAVVGHLFTMTLSADDPDNDSLVFSIDNPVTGMAISNGSSFTWTPPANDTGLHVVYIVASDGKGGSTTLLWNIFVDAQNHSPVFVTAGLSLDERIKTGTHYSASFRATDRDNDPVTYSLVSVINGMSITDTTIGWTPAIADTGIHTVSVRASDGKGGSATLNWSLTVDVANHSPSFISTAADFPDTLFTGDPFIAVFSASDPDGDSLSYSIVSGPSGMVIGSISMLTYTPVTQDIGPHEIKVKVEDNKGGSDTLTFAVTVVVKP